MVSEGLECSIEQSGEQSNSIILSLLNHIDLYITITIDPEKQMGIRSYSLIGFLSFLPDHVAALFHRVSASRQEIPRVGVLAHFCFSYKHI